MTLALAIAGGMVAAWIGWRLLSRHAVLPCPADLAWLVETENPLARATHAARIVAHLAPRRGARLADVGCGPGRVTLPLARAVGPEGTVIALDLQPAMLDRVAAKAAAAGSANIVLRAAAAGGGLAPASLDGAVMVMALGEIPDAAATLAGLGAALVPGGRLVIGESVFDPHYVRRGRVRALAEATGFTVTSWDGDLFGYSVALIRPAT